MKELSTQSTMEFTENYRPYWTKYVLQMPYSRTPLQILHYQPNGQRYLGLPTLLQETERSCELHVREFSQLMANRRPLFYHCLTTICLCWLSSHEWDQEYV